MSARSIPLFLILFISTIRAGGSAALTELKPLLKQPLPELLKEYDHLSQDTRMDLRRIIELLQPEPTWCKLLDSLPNKPNEATCRKIKRFWKDPVVAKVRTGLDNLCLEREFRDGLDRFLCKREECDRLEGLLLRRGLLGCTACLARKPEVELRVELENFLMRPLDELRGALERGYLLRLLKVLPVWNEQAQEEFGEWLLAAPQPSAVIRDMCIRGGLKKLLPEVWGLINLPQDKQWHPEGDVFEHTMLVLDAASEAPCIDRRERLTLLCGAIAHDLGKKVTTRYFPDPTCDKKAKIVWRIGSARHEHEGEPIAHIMMERMGVDGAMAEAVAKLARWHMEHGRLKRCSIPATIAKKFKELREGIEGHVPFITLLKLMEADMRGSGTTDGRPKPPQSFELIDEYKAFAREEGLYKDPAPSRGSTIADNGRAYALHAGKRRASEQLDPAEGKRYLSER